MKGCPGPIFEALFLLIFGTCSSNSNLDSFHNESASFKASQLPREPTYFILSSEALEQGHDYQLIVSLFKTTRGKNGDSYSFPHSVTAEILRDGSVVVSRIIDIYWGMTESITLSIPEHIFVQSGKMGRSPVFKLVVLGHEFGKTDRLLFKEEKALILKKQKIWIYVETEKPIYTPGQTVSGKVIPFQVSNHRPWTGGSLEATLTNPRGEIMGKWKDLRLILSKTKRDKRDYVILLKYELADATQLGEWTFEVSSKGDTDSSGVVKKSFWVEEYFPQDIEVRVWLPPTVIPGDTFVNGWISSNKVVGGASVPGTLRLYAILKDNSTDPHSLRMRINFDFEGKNIFLSTREGYSEMESFSGFGEWRISSEEINYIRSTKNSSFLNNASLEMTLEAHLIPSQKFWKSNGRSEDLSYSYKGGVVNTQSVIGYATTRLLSKNLEMKILMPPNSLPYRPDLPYIAWVRVLRSDGSDLTLKDLEQGTMSVESSLVFQNASRIELTPLSLRRQHKFFTPGSHPLWKLSYSLRHVLPSKMEEMNLMDIYGPLLLYTELKVKYKTRSMEVEKKIKLVPQRGIHMNAQDKRIIQQGLRVSASPIVPMIGDNIIFHVHSNFFLEGFQIAFISSNQNIISTRYIMMGQSSIKTFHEIATESMAPESTLIIWVLTSDGNIVSAATKFTVEAGTAMSIIKIMSEPIITSGFGGYTEVTLQAGSNTREKTFVSFHALDIYLKARTPQVPFPNPDRIHGAQLCGDFKSHGLMVMTDALLQASNDITNLSSTMTSLSNNGFVQFEKDAFDQKPLIFPRASPVSSELRGNGFWKTVAIYPGKNLTLRIPFVGNGGRLILSPLAFSRNTGYFQHPELTLSIGNPFHVTLEVPEYCRYGEVLSGRLTFINKYNHALVKDIRIYKSVEFTFVDLEGNAKDESMKTFSLDIPANSFQTFQIPFRPSKSGKITIQVQIGTSKHLLKKSIIVMEEGVPMHFHESKSIDLINHRFFVDHFRPPSLGKKEIIISGGIHGPLLPTIPMNTTTIIQSIPVISADESVFAIFIALFHREESGNYVVSSSINPELKNSLQVILQRLLTYRTDKNAFSFTHNGTPCVWISALALRALHKLSMDSIGIFVDPSIPKGALSWLLQQQNNDGSFKETYLYRNVKSEHLPPEMQVTALTAHVLLALAEMKHDTSSPQTIFTIDRAIHFLTSKLGELDSYGSTLEVALVSRALQVARATGAEAAFEILAKRRKETSEGFYWTFGSENNLYSPQSCDNSLSVRTTAMALLVYTERGEFMTESIIRWLNSKRRYFYGWSTTLDTAYVLEAFNLWTLRHIHHLRKSMSRSLQKNSVTPKDTVAIEVRSSQSDSSAPTESIRVMVEDGMSQSIIPLRMRGSEHIDIEGSGRGLALIQLHSVSKVTSLSKKQSTNSTKQGAQIHLDAHADTTKDVSEIRLRTCHRWLCLNEESVSGPVILQIQLPTGFEIIRSDLLEALKALKTEEIREEQGQINIFFSRLSRSVFDCVNLSMVRIYRVARISPYIYIKIFDYYAPDRFNETLLFLPKLVEVNICDICGSSECPNCGEKEASPFSANGCSPTIYFFHIRTIIPVILILFLCRKILL